MKKITFKTKFTLPTIVQDIAKTFRAIQWPTPLEILKSLLAVFVISVIIGAYLWLLDSTFEHLRNTILFN